MCGIRREILLMSDIEEDESDLKEFEEDEDFEL